MCNDQYYINLWNREGPPGCFRNMMILILILLYILW